MELASIVALLLNLPPLLTFESVDRGVELVCQNEFILLSCNFKDLGDIGVLIIELVDLKCLLFI